MNRYASVLQYQPIANGLYQRVEQHGDWESTTTTNSDGIDRSIAIARQHEQWGDALAAVTETLSLRCAAHGLPIAELSWDVNDFACEPEKEPRFVEFILNGWHGYNGDGAFCVAARGHTTPAGLVVAQW